jgi:hypothetical protein
MQSSASGNPPDTSKLGKLVSTYAEAVRTHFGEAPDMTLLRAVAKSLEPSILRGDQALVATSDENELATVRSFIRDKLGEKDAARVDAALEKVIRAYGSETPNKHRAVLYYALAVELGREAVFGTVAAAAPTEEDHALAKPPGDGTGGSNGSSNDGSGSGGGNSNEGGKKVPIIFIDAKAAEQAANSRLDRELKNLEKRKEDKGNLSRDEVQKLDLLQAILTQKGKPAYSLDDTYVALREHMAKLLPRNAFPDLHDGRFGAADSVDAMNFADLAAAAVWGSLTGEGVVAPAVLEATEYRNGEIVLLKPSSRFSQAMTAAFAEFTSHSALFTAVLKVMAEAKDVNDSGELNARDWVAVTRALVVRGTTETTPSLAGRIRAAIEDRLSPKNDKVTATAQIILPDLEKNTAQEVQAVNLEAAQAVYFAAMMDEARLFEVVDKLAELFQIGALALERGPAGEYLYRYIRNTPERISAYERRNTYARVFGVATGDPNAPGAQFRNFDDLWLRFISAVSDWYRKNQVESLFATSGRYVPSQEQLRKTGLDLAANLSLYCYGGTWFVASELQKNISEYVDLLSSPEIKRLYGARDMWQVIDQVSVLEFGRPVNTIRARTMASAGATIIGWLEKKSNALSQPGSVLIDPDELANPPSRSTANSINDPSDYDLVTACEQWLAIEGVGGDIVELKAAASPSAATQTAPVRVPPAAQEILGAFGFSHNGQATAPGSYRNGAARAH